MYGSAGILNFVVTAAFNKASLYRYMATAPDIYEDDVSRLISEARNLESLAASAIKGDLLAIEFLFKDMNLESAFYDYENLINIEEASALDQFSK